MSRTPAQWFRPNEADPVRKGFDRALREGRAVKWGLVDWIWRVRGSLPLTPRQSNDDVFERLDPLFRERGTSFERTGDTLHFRKRNQAPQDRLAAFDDGVLWIEQKLPASVLRYRLTSRAMLYCFLAPMLFLAIAQFTIAVGAYAKASAEAAEKAGKALDKEKDEEKKASAPMNPIDQFLGAPAPEKPKKEDPKKKKAKELAKKYSPTSAYVFAGIFALLYVVGRILEDRLVKRRFRRQLQGA